MDFLHLVRSHAARITQAPKRTPRLCGVFLYLGMHSQNFRPIPSQVKDIRKYLISEIDRLFSLYVRQFHANDFGICHCATCGKMLHWRKIQTGHYMSRRYFATRWNFKNVGPQCAGCNAFGKRRLSGVPGEGGAMAAWIDAQYGPDTAALLRRQSKMLAKWTITEMQILRAELYQKLEQNKYEVR